jgi:hypothetical protein
MFGEGAAVLPTDGLLMLYDVESGVDSIGESLGPIELADVAPTTHATLFYDPFDSGVGWFDGYSGAANSLAYFPITSGTLGDVVNISFTIICDGGAPALQERSSGGTVLGQVLAEATTGTYSFEYTLKGDGGILSFNSDPSEIGNVSVSNFSVEKERDVSEITIVSGLSDSITSAYLQFEPSDIFEEFDTEYGGDIMFDSANAGTPFIRTWSEWANIFAGLNQTRLFWGMKTLCAIYSVSQDAETSWDINKYIRGYGTYFRGYGVYGTVQDWIGIDHADFYVDSVNGDDTNDGTEPVSAFATVAKLKEQTIPTNAVIALAAGSSWEDGLDFEDAFTGTIVGYGAGKRPVFDGATQASNSDFTLSSGYTNVYQIEWATNLLVVEGEMYSVWEDGDRLEYVESIALCESTPGSYYAPLVTSNLETIYIHPTGSTSPITNGSLYELPNTTIGIRAKKATIKYVKCSRASHPSGPLQALNIYGCMGHDGLRHNVFTYGGAVTDSIAWKSDTVERASATLFVGYVATAVGQSMTFDRCIGIDNEGGGIAGLIHCHCSGGKFSSVKYTDMAGYNTTSISAGETDVFEVTRVKTKVKEQEGPILNPSLADVSLFKDVYVIMPSADSLSYLYADSEGRYSVFDGLRVYASNETATLLQSIVGRVEINNSVIYRDTVTVGTWFRTASNQELFSVKNSIIVTNTTYDLIFDHDIPYSLDNNCYYSPNGSYRWRDVPLGVSVTTLPLWVAGTGQDSMSLATDPMLTDPSNGDFNLDVSSPAIGIGAGLLRPDVEYLELLDDETLALW